MTLGRALLFAVAAMLLASAALAQSSEGADEAMRMLKGELDPAYQRAARVF